MHLHYFKTYGDPLHVPRFNRQPRNAIMKHGQALIPVVSKGEVSYSTVDKEFAYLAKYKWYKSKSGRYACARIPGSNEALRMHRVIVNAPEGMVVDHKNGNCLDNRKSNLRICTQHENAANSITNNKEKPRSIYYEPAIKKYRVRIGIVGRLTNFGSYETIEEALYVRNHVCEQLWGEYFYGNR